MWRLYILLMLTRQSLNAQQANSRGDNEQHNLLNSLDLLSENNYKTQLMNINNNNKNSIRHSAATPAQNNTEKTQLYEAGNFSKTWKIPTTKNSFNSKLFHVMSVNSQHENLIYSPISLETVLGFMFIMSEGVLYKELAQLFPTSNNRTVENLMLQMNSLNKSPTNLIMANKLYYDYRLGSIDNNLRNFTLKSYALEIEQMDFHNSQKAAGIINSWISEKTRQLIHKVVTPSSLSAETSALLLNSLYFKSEWLNKFATYDTETQDFFTTKQTKLPVDMMYNEDIFRYGDFDQDLQASVVELPYKTPNLSMLIILPKDIEGLADLENKLQDYDLQTISQQLKREIVAVKLPRFKIEYEVDMTNPLQELGVNALFNSAGNINLFKNQQQPLKIDQFKHKSFIKVNEAGTEAAAATVAKYVPLSIPSDLKHFVADHPFIFVIRHTNTIFFVGHVVHI